MNRNKKMYETPSLKITELDASCLLLAGSDVTPAPGTSSDEGTGKARPLSSSYSIWGADE